jgi:hypothetical protein
VKVPDQGATVLLGQEDHEADRGEASVEFLQRVETLLVMDLEAVERPKIIALVENGAPVASGRGTGGERFVAAQNLPQVLVPLLWRVPLVGDKSEMASGTEHPTDLPAGGHNIKPMERLGYGYCVRDPGAERELLGPSGDETSARGVVAELRPHAGHGFDGDDLGTGLFQEPGELAGPGGHVDDPGAGSESELIGEDLDGGIGIARAAQLVASTFGVRPPRGGVGRGRRIGQNHRHGC